jgi:hypothetical protein
MVAFSLALKINFTSKMYLATNKRARSYIYNNKPRFNDHVFQNGFSRCVRTSGTYETMQLCLSIADGTIFRLNR